MIGSIEPGGKVASEFFARARGKDLQAFTGRHADKDASVTIADQWPAHRQFGRTMDHADVDYFGRYVDGLRYVITAEDPWAFLKRAWWSAGHHYSKRHAHAYPTEACLKFNARDIPNGFDVLVGDALAA